MGVSWMALGAGIGVLFTVNLLNGINRAIGQSNWISALTSPLQLILAVFYFLWASRFAFHMTERSDKDRGAKSEESNVLTEENENRHDPISKQKTPEQQQRNNSQIKDESDPTIPEQESETDASLCGREIAAQRGLETTPEGSNSEKYLTESTQQEPMVSELTEEWTETTQREGSTSGDVSSTGSARFLKIPYILHSGSSHQSLSETEPPIPYLAFPKQLNT